ncbi:MAG: hypothetical protein ACYC9Y_04220 [Candidatus Methylomirabilia bacterium]
MRLFSDGNMRYFHLVQLLACVFLCAVAPLWAAGPAAKSLAPQAGMRTALTDTLVDSILTAHGGKAALAKAKAYRMEGSVSSMMRGNGALVRTFARPDRLKITLDYPNHPETRILDGARGWRSDGQGNLSPADGFLLTSMVLQAARADLPWLLEEKRASIKPLAPMDGGRLQGLEIPVADGLTLTVYADTATGRIVRSSGVLETPGMKTNFATDYSDFRTVDGVLFSFREANFASNQPTGDTVITRITVNPALKDTDFRP